MRHWQYRLASLSGLMWSGLAAAAPLPDTHPERQLVSALDKVQSGQITEALSGLDRLIKEHPTFRLAQLFYGELLATRAGALGTTLLTEDPRLNELVEEARLRLRQQSGPPAGSAPDAILSLSSRHRHALVVDLPAARLYLMENRDGKLEVTRHYYAAMGKNGSRKQVKGDNRTPVGVYHITGWLPDGELPDFYGAGAFPLNYPNLWDQRAGRTGSGIWLHGVPSDTYSRPPRSSEGCVTLANTDLLALKPYVRIGETPVIFSDTLQWQDEEARRAERDAFLKRIENWRGRWSARDTEGYLEYYAEDFTAEGLARNAFAEHKRRVNGLKRFIDVKVRDIDIYRYPGDEPLVLAQFTQDYKSDNFATSTRKQQYWRQNKKGEWQIVREENL